MYPILRECWRILAEKLAAAQAAKTLHLEQGRETTPVHNDQNQEIMRFLLFEWFQPVSDSTEVELAQPSHRVCLLEVRRG